VKSNQATGNLWSRFWFTPAPTTGLAAVRFLSGMLFACWLLSFLGHQESFFSLRGLFDAEGYRAIQAQRQQDALAGPLGWSLLYLAGDSATLFQAMYWGSITIFLLFASGVATRITGVLTWLAVVSFLANPATNYEGDYLLGILAFYLMLGYLFVGQWNGNLSFAERVFGSRDDILFANLNGQRDERPPSYAANFVMRLLQVHFALIIVVSGLHKLQHGDWWSGIAFWNALHPAFQTTRETLLRERANAPTVMFFLSLIQYGVLAWQLSFPAFAWRSGPIARTILLGGAVLGWAGAAFFLKLPLFGPFTCIGAVCFLRPEEWAALKVRAATMLHRPAQNANASALAKEMARK
jgi:hypothetical protein